MRIIGLINEWSGCTYHRIQLPLYLMDGPDCHLTNVLREEQLQKGCDILYISRYANHNKLEQILDWKKKYEFKLIVDVDDYWHLDSHHIGRKEWSKNNIPQLFVNYIEAADAITTTHERLREKILPYNSNVEIFPNAIPVGYSQYNISKTESERVRLFWQGSNTHRKDIELLRNPLKRVCSELSNDVTMVFAGFLKSQGNSITECEQMVSAYTCGNKLNNLIIDRKMVDDYYSAYKHCDISLVPLLDTTFNNYKSNLKVLEAAAIGAPVIVSKVNPYLDLPEDVVCYVERQSDWFKWIRLLTWGKRYRQEMGEALRDYCNEHFNFYKINEARKEFICRSEILIY